jgi:methyl-accepting chemotaxis protein
MEFLRRFSIGQRTQYALLTLSLACLLLTAFTAWRLHHLDQSMSQAVSQAATATTAQRDATLARLHEQVASIFQSTLGSGAVIALFGIGLSIGIKASIKGPIEALVAAVQRMGSGDLESKISSPGRDDISWLNHELNSMRKKLREMVLSVRQSADSVQTAAQEIASGNTDLSQRTESQAAALQQTSSSINQLAGTVRDNAAFAREASTLVGQANDVATHGGELMHDVVARMSDINQSANRIAEIVQVIDGIAFQTNILALNAAVEAARAGEQGRGFAVVAGEVRALAQRSATAAKEVKTLINDSVEKVNAGFGLVDEAGKTMQEITSSVSRVARLVSDIAAAGAEQSTGIEQIHQAIAQMDDMTQRNAALVEQAAAAAQSLSGQSEQLTHTVGTFRVAA